MGFSEWYHIDFKVIRRRFSGNLEIVAEDGNIYVLPSKDVADQKDYQAGDRNGTISIREELAEQLGLI